MFHSYPEYWPQFLIATILEWKPLLQNKTYRDEIIKSLCPAHNSLSRLHIFIHTKWLIHKEKRSKIKSKNSKFGNKTKAMVVEDIYK